jgi:hypothetical protein
MIEVGLHDADYLEVCRHFRAVFETPMIKDDQEKAFEVWLLMKREGGSLRDSGKLRQFFQNSFFKNGKMGLFLRSTLCTK